MAMRTADISIILQKARKSVYAYNILFLSVNDLLFGFYLIFLFAADQYYGELYVVYASSWLGSNYCKVLGIVVSFVMLNSLFLLNMLSVSRVVMVRYPFYSKINNNNLVIRSTVIMYTFNMILSLTFLFVYHAVEKGR